MDNVLPSKETEWELLRTLVLLPNQTSKVCSDCRSHWTLEMFLSPRMIVEDGSPFYCSEEETRG